MLASPDQQISLTDPDSRSMATSGRGSGVVGYNVQVAVETENHLIVTHEVTNRGSDRSQLAQRRQSRPRPSCGTDTLEAVADRGYFNSPEILECHEAGITVTLPKPMTSGAKAEGRFGKQDFVYLPDEDVYRCPAGERLKYATRTRRTDRSCAATGPQRVRHCPLKARCTTGPGAAHHALGARARAGGCAEAARREPAGHASAARDGRASVRHDQDADGRDALPDEDAAARSPPRWRLHVLAYNLTRVMNIIGVKPLIAAMGA